VGEVLHGSLLQLLLEHCDFVNIDISQGSVATRLRCGGIFKYVLVANLPVSLPVKKIWKSVNIWGSYGREFGVLFFWDTVYTALAQRRALKSETDRRTSAWYSSFCWITSTHSSARCIKLSNFFRGSNSSWLQLSSTSNTIQRLIQGAPTKRETTNSRPLFCQIMADFQNSFTDSDSLVNLQ